MPTKYFRIQTIYNNYLSGARHHAACYRITTKSLEREKKEKNLTILNSLREFWVNYAYILPIPILPEQGKEMTLRCAFKKRENFPKSKGSDECSRWQDCHRNRKALSIILGNNGKSSLAL